MDDSRQALYYATAMPRRNGAIPLVVDDRRRPPDQIEGNPLHPASGGATDTFAQASVLDLYDPSRSQRFVHKGKRRIAPSLRNTSANFARRLTANGGDGLAFLVEETHSPTRERLRAELEKTFPEDALVRLRTAPGQAQAFARRKSLRRQRAAHSAIRIARMSFLRWTAIFSIADKAISNRCAHSPRAEE